MCIRDRDNSLLEPRKQSDSDSASTIEEAASVVFSRQSSARAAFQNHEDSFAPDSLDLLESDARPVRSHRFGGHNVADSFDVAAMRSGRPFRLDDSDIYEGPEEDQVVATGATAANLQVRGFGWSIKRPVYEMTLSMK